MYLPCRLTKKPWSADPGLMAIISKLITGKSAITKLIAYSPNFKSIFNMRAKINEESVIDCQKLRDLNYAKNRFHSTQKPLGRFVLTLDALIATAVEITIRRKGAPEACASEFLASVTEEDVLTIAMLADAGDESSAIVRFFDKEDYDVAAVPEVISMYLHRIDHLFIKRHCLTLVGTYTEYILDVLKKPHPIILHKQGRVRSLGGNTLQPEMVNRCISRMVAWVRLVMASIAAEFPSWEVLNAFSAFNLKFANTPFVHDSLCRLANVFGLDAAKLQSEFDDFRTFANHQLVKGLDNCAAWRESILSIRRSGQVKIRHPHEQLRAAFCRYALCMGATTSGVERSFSSILSVINKQRQSIRSSVLANDIKLKLLTSDIGRSDQEICLAAMSIWVATYGHARLSGNRRLKQRWVSGRRVERQRSKLAESQWTANRRLAVDRLVQSGKKRTFAEMSADANRLSRGGWTPGHDKAAR